MGPHDEDMAEITDDCKSAMVSVSGPGSSVTVAQVGGALNAEQIAAFFENDPNFNKRYVVATVIRRLLRNKSSDFAG